MADAEKKEVQAEKTEKVEVKQPEDEKKHDVDYADPEEQEKVKIEGLKDVVIVKGTEDEVCLFKNRAKLFRFRDS